MTNEEFAKTFPNRKWLLPHHEPSPPKPSWSELPGNVVPSAVNAATGLYEMVRHPVRTLQALENVAGGAMNLVGADEINTYLADRGLAVRRNSQDVAREESAATAVGQALKDRYWGLDNLKRTIITDPFGSALDVVGVATGVGGLVRGGLAAGSKARRAGSSATDLNSVRPAVVADVGTGTPAIEMKPGNPVLADNIAQNSLKEVVFADSKRNKIYAPPTKPQRPFKADYTKGVKDDEVDELGNLLVNRHGERFSPDTLIFGRRVAGGDDVNATYKDFKELSKRLGKPIQFVPRQQIEGKPGSVLFDPETNVAYGVYLADDLDMKKSRNRHIGKHEIIHLLDLVMGREPVPPEIRKEMESVYSTLATGKENLRQPTLPGDRGYSPDSVRDELVAESGRAAFEDTNYMKSVAPKTYDWWDERLARHPHIGVRLNSAGAASAAALGAMGLQDDSETAEISRQPGSQAKHAKNMLSEFESGAGTDGPAELAPTLARSRAPSHTGKTEKLRDIARILVNLKARKDGHLHGGPR